MNEVAENVVAEDQVETEAQAEEVKEQDSNVVRAFLDGVENEKDEDSIKIDMIQAGAKFANVTRIFNKLMIENGFAISKEQKDELVKVACEERDLSTEEGFGNAVAYIVQESNNIDERQAGFMVRGYCRKNEVPYYKKPKVTGTRVSFQNTLFAALLENPKMTEEEVHQIIVEKGSENTLKAEKTHQKVRVFANAIAEKYGI